MVIKTETVVNISILISIALSSILICCVKCRPQEKEYPVRLQPELDVLDVETYLKNPRLLKIQIQCILYDGPCDVVGKWAKPRVKAGLLGECLKCTEKQKGWLSTYLERLIEEQPALYRASVAKFIYNSGIEIPQDELDMITKNIEQSFKTNATSSTSSKST